MWCVIIFQSTLVYLSYNTNFFNQKSARFEIFRAQNVTANFQAQSFEISEESISAI